MLPSRIAIAQAMLAFSVCSNWSAGVALSRSTTWPSMAYSQASKAPASAVKNIIASSHGRAPWVAAQMKGTSR